MIAGTIVGGAIASGIFGLIAFYGAQARGPQRLQSRKERSRCMSISLVVSILLFLFFVGSALYNWTDAKARLPDTPVSVSVFIVYVVFAIEAVLCLTTLYALDV